MNCSALSITRTATTTGCSPLTGGAFLAISPPNGTSVKSKSITGGIKPTKSIMTANVATTATLPLHTSNETTTTMSNISKDNSNSNSKKADLAAKIIQESNIVCFDVDSTVIKEEGIDELAEFCGKGSEVARVTKEAMGGAMTFQDALKIRLNIIRPTQKQIADFVKLRPSTLTRNVKHFIEQLKANGKQVFLISGGFDCLIEPVAQELGISTSNLFANKLLFDYNGEYASFDTTQPTSKSGGKAEAISIIKRQNPDTLITMIGDGATDLEAVPPANYFIGFGGNVLRAEVFKRAQYYVTDFGQLM